MLKTDNQDLFKERLTDLIEHSSKSGPAKSLVVSGVRSARLGGVLLTYRHHNVICRLDR